MSKLIKAITSTHIPGDPGAPGAPATPATPGYWVDTPVTVCEPAPPTPVGLSDGSFIYISSPHIQSVVCSTTYTSTWQPPIAAYPGIPYSPPTAEQITISLNEGWNSYASTISELVIGGHILYTVKLGTKGALVSVAPPGFEGRNIGDFTHGVMTDISGIHVFESGVLVTTLATNQLGTEVYIARTGDGRIVYSTSTGGIHISDLPRHLISADLYIYGMLYAGYDEVSYAAFGGDVSVAEPAVSMRGTSTLLAATPIQVIMEGYGGLLASPRVSALLSGRGAIEPFAVVEQQIEVTPSGGSYLYATMQPPGGRGESLVPYFFGIGGDTEYGQGIGDIPRITSGRTNGASVHVPPQITRGYSNTPFISSTGHGTDIGIGTSVSDIPTFIGLSGDYSYGFGYSTLPTHVGVGYGGFVASNEMIIVSPMLGVMSMDKHIDLVLIISSSGRLESAHAATRSQAIGLLSMLQAASGLGILGVYGYSMLSNMRGITLQTLSVNDRPDLHDGGVVWVINRDTGASSQYEQYGFNSFFQRGDKYYGVADDGVYLLEGNTDAGADVAALVEMGRTNLGYTNDKRVPMVYLGVGSDAELYLKVDVDTQTYVYSMRTSGEAVRNRPVETGWNVSGCYWNFTLMNPNGSNFNLASMAFTPVPLARRG